MGDSNYCMITAMYADVLSSAVHIVTEFLTKSFDWHHAGNPPHERDINLPNTLIHLMVFCSSLDI